MGSDECGYFYYLGNNLLLYKFYNYGKEKSGNNPCYSKIMRTSVMTFKVAHFIFKARLQS